MPFEKFVPPRASRHSVRDVTLTRRGVFTVPEALIREIGDPSHLVVMYDKDESLIGLRASPPDDPDAYKLRKSGNRSILEGRAFSTHHGIARGQTMEIEDVENDTLIFRDRSRAMPGR